MEQGHEVLIPNCLRIDQLPNSFKYYEPLIKVAQNLCSQKKKKYLSMQFSLVNHYDKKYSLLGLMGMNQKKNEKVKLDSTNEFNVLNMLYPNRIDPDVSLHTK